MNIMRIRHRRRHHNHSSGRSMSLPGFLTFLADTVLVQIIFKTILIEEITSNELFRIILKIITTFISIALIISSFVF